MSTPVIDKRWQSLLDRLAKAATAMEESLGHSDVRTRQILDERAKLMALAVARSRSEELNLEVLTFNLGSQRCGIPTRFVFEMLALPTVTPLPGVAPHVLGACSVRGQILLVMDLALLFGFPSSKQDDTAIHPQLLIVGAERPELGVVCQGFGQTARLAKSTISNSAELSVPPLGRCAAGVTVDGLLLLDGRELLKDSRLYVNQSG